MQMEPWSRTHECCRASLQSETSVGDCAEQVKRNLRAFPVWQRLDLVGGAAMLYFGAPLQLLATHVHCVVGKGVGLITENAPQLHHAEG